MSRQKRERFKGKNPESAYFDRLKGKHISVVAGRNTLHGELVWVDVYTFGVRKQAADLETVMVYKGPGLMVAKTHADNIPDDWKAEFARRQS